MVSREIELECSVERGGTRRLGARLHREQHAFYIAVIGNRERFIRLRAHLARGSPLHAITRPVERLLVRALGERVAFEPDRKPRRIHHDEHVLETAIRLTDEIADRTALVSIREYAGWT